MLIRALLPLLSLSRYLQGKKMANFSPSSDHIILISQTDDICFSLIKLKIIEMEFKEFEPRFKSAKTRFKLSAGLNLETFDTILSETNHIKTAA